MSNIFETFLNRPKEYKTGQIWHCSEISEDIVLTDVNEYYLKMGIARGMILSRATHLNDGKDLTFKPKGELKKLYGLERIMLRITDGPILTEDLSFYKDEIPKSKSSKITETLKHRPKLNPVQEEFSAMILEKLQPLREKVILKCEEYENKMNKLKILIVLNALNKKAIRIQYKNAAADENEKARFVEFWEKERDARDQSVILNEDDKSIFRLVNIDGRLYFTAKSEIIKKISDIKMVQKKIIISSVDNEIHFGKEKRVFTSFEDDSKIKAGDWELHLKIDGKTVKFIFGLK